ncbi:MAG: hypothetical protein ACK4PK_08800 [Alphaproteobacteria bacterium]|jgi:hypothetical protein
MTKASKLFVFAEFIHSCFVREGVKRGMISSADPEKITAEQLSDYNQYKIAVSVVMLCLVGFLLYMRAWSIVVYVVAGLCARAHAENIYARLAPQLSGLTSYHVDSLKEAREQDVFTDLDSAAPAAEASSGSGPWVVYVIDADGAEKRLPRRFETDSAAQVYADLQLVLSRGKISHSGVTYAPEK